MEFNRVVQSIEYGALNPAFAAAIGGPVVGDRTLPELEEVDTTEHTGPYIVILYNDDYHAMDEVVSQIQKATGYDFERCIYIMLEAHTQGRAVAYTGSEEECERAARVLRQIRLQVETDRA